MTDATPATPSLAYKATEEDRELIADVKAGLPAIRAKRDRYLTRWPQEQSEAFERRLNDAMWTPIFNDLLFGLTSKPFTKPVILKEGASDRIMALAEDIDGEGNSLSVFAQDVFDSAVSDGLCAIFVDFPVNQEARTRRDEQQLRLRPYFVKVEAAQLLALYTEVVGGVEVIQHARIMETATVRDGFEERVVERVRVLEPGMYALYEKRTDAAGRVEWMQVGEGVMSLDYVPLTVFYTNKRRGPQLVKPPLVDLARLQLELYRAQNNLKQILARTGFPMIAINGMSKPAGETPAVIGPGAMIWTGEGAQAEIIEPAGSSIQQVRDDIDDLKQEMRRLGMQPLMPGSGSAVTATATREEADKAHSLVKMWVLALGNTLEEAFKFTADWLGEQVEAEVVVHTDFDVGFMADQSIQALLACFENGTISRRALLEELKRRNVLSADYDIDEDADVIAEERETAMATLPDLVPLAGPEPAEAEDADEAEAA